MTSVSPLAPRREEVEIVRDGRRLRVPIIADTVDEYLALLRGVLKASGRTAGKIASYHKIPRSTAYSFTSPDNHALPKKRSQLRRFLEGCKLAEPQIVEMLNLWYALRAAEVEKRDSEKLDGAATSAGTELVRLPRSDLAPTRQIDGATWVQAHVIDDLVTEANEGQRSIDDLLAALRMLTNGGTFNAYGDIHINIGSTNGRNNEHDEPPEPFRTDGAGTSTEDNAVSPARRRLRRLQIGRSLVQFEADDRGGEAGSGYVSSGAFTQEQARFRNRLLSIVLAAILLFGFIGILFPVQVTVFTSILIVFTMLAFVLLKWRPPR